ncbi:membrane-associated proteins in eicosanoid and glutathione metabolism [Canariomyces notabilis]|uniref:Membrane-associated proteins in eicosanoid and glutathione metabolism n=1 Tax=Canariomyces notabilis TaxID=2074819 RepID=A0AAN6TG07_9PEZI|nr:membrane-associated proteins in eicosanoid and glutathione metabolism [Canariomyces arenarius]
MAITLPDEYGYVLAVATSTFFINTLHAVLTSNRRRSSGIKYPVAYATNEVAEKDPKAYAFNCAQRAHANFTENLTPFLGAMLVSGLRYPIYAAGVGAAWSAARVMYALGYTSSKGPQGRTLWSAIGFLCDFAVKGMALRASAGWVLGW